MGDDLRIGGSGPLAYYERAPEDDARRAAGGGSGTGGSRGVKYILLPLLLILLLGAFLLWRLRAPSPPSAPVAAVETVAPASSAPPFSPASPAAGTREVAVPSRPRRSAAPPAPPTPMIPAPAPAPTPAPVAPSPAPPPPPVAAVPLPVAPMRTAETTTPTAPPPVPPPVAAQAADTLEMEFVLVPPGTFRMGAIPDDPKAEPGELPARPVRITRGFFLGKFEVTRRQWRKIMGKNAPGGGGDDIPAANISWDDAQAFLARLNERHAPDRFRLPTEAEWEHACRAGGESLYFWGDDPLDAASHANFADANSDAPERSANQNDGYGGAAPVGSYLPNRLGLYDMAGNVYEWCADRYEPGYYTLSPSADPAGPSAGGKRVARGGSFTSPLKYLRASDRARNTPGHRGPTVGFRVVKELLPER